MTQGTGVASNPPVALFVGRHRSVAILIALALLAAAALLLAGIVGSVVLPLADLAAALGELLRGAPSTLAATLLELRLGRAQSAFVTGGALALAGVMMQALLRNPLADPYVLGVSGGAAVGALAAMLFMASAWMIDAAAFGGAVTVALLLYLLARRDLRGGVAAEGGGVAVAADRRDLGVGLRRAGDADAVDRAGQPFARHGVLDDRRPVRDPSALAAVAGVGRSPAVRAAGRTVDQCDGAACGSRRHARGARRRAAQRTVFVFGGADRQRRHQRRQHRFRRADRAACVPFCAGARPPAADACGGAGRWHFPGAGRHTGAHRAVAAAIAGWRGDRDDRRAGIPAATAPYPA